MSIKVNVFCFYSLIYKICAFSYDAKSESVKLEVDRKTRRTAPINILSGILLKTVLFLDENQPKLLIAGIFKDKGDSLGLLFKSKKSYIYWSFDVFNELAVHFESVIKSFTDKSKFKFALESGEGISMKNSFGTQYVILNDNEHSVALSKSEWDNFVRNLPILNSHCRDLFMIEDSIKELIKNLICEEDVSEKLINLPWNLTNRLQEEISVLKTDGSSR